MVLTRKVGEQINIADEIVVSVVEISKGKVRIGIDAPSSISILRQEVYERVRIENMMSSKGATSAKIKAMAILFKDKKNEGQASGT